MFKLAIFWTGTFSAIICGIIGCKIYRPLACFLFGTMIFSLFFSGLSINFFSVEVYRGTSRGFEVHLADILAVILTIHMLQHPNLYKICWIPRLTVAFGLYISTAILSWAFTASSLYNPLSNDPVALQLQEGFLELLFQTKVYPLFEIYKLLRGYFIFWVTVNFVNDVKAIKTVAITAVMMLWYSTITSLTQRYVLGIHRVTALSDINIFNCFVGMLGGFAMPFAFYTKNLMKSCFYWTAPIGALLSIILTISRSSLVGYLIAMIIVIIFSIRRFRSLQNFIAVGIILLISVGLLGKAAQTMSARFLTYETTAASLAERGAYNDAALLMGEEHLFGVGINNFSAFSVNEYAERVGTERGALAHEIWFLTFAELGYPGLIALIFFWLNFYWIFFRCWRLESQNHNNLIYTVLIGIFASILVLQIQSLFHFSYRHTSVFFLSCIFLGLTVRCWMVLKEEDRKRKAQNRLRK